MSLTLDQASSQLLVVDVQERLIPAMRRKQATISCCQRLLEGARRLSVPITLSEQYPRGLGATIPEIHKAAGNEAVVLEKITFSCWRDPGLRDRLSALREAGRNQVVVVGMETHVCVAQTVLDLVAEGFQPFVVADGVTSRTKANRKLGLRRMAQAGVQVVSSEMVLFEWLGRAGTPEFKDVQRLIK